MARLAIHGGRPVRAEPFPSWPMHDVSERKALNGVLQSGKCWSGKKVQAFEERLREHRGIGLGGRGCLYAQSRCSGSVSGWDDLLKRPRFRALYGICADTSEFLCGKKREGPLRNLRSRAASS